VEGSVVSKGKLTVAWFHQHFVDQLDLDKCPLEEMREKMGEQATEQELRRALGRFGVNADLAVRPNRLLSGGQKARYVKSVFMIHVGCTRCVTSSTDNIMKIHARITLTVEFIRKCIFLFLFHV
jgi:hypothetical protein